MWGKWEMPPALLHEFTVNDQIFGLLQNLEVVFDYAIIGFRDFYKT